LAKQRLNSNKTDGTDDRGLIFNIQKFSLHDGSGIRTLVFLKGCPLRCKWCSNPEGQAGYPELAYNRSKCIKTVECGWCIQVCKLGAIKEDGNGKVDINRKLCNNCGDCVEICPSKALEILGRCMSVEEVIGVIEEDSTFYARSGGGLTLGGGDPVFQPEFAVRLLKSAQDRGIDTAIETTGYSDWQDLEDICMYANTVFFDIKCIDPGKHKRGTGFTNELILENFQKLGRTFDGLSIVARTPVVPGFNDTKTDIEAIVDFIKGSKGDYNYELLPYHRFGEPKYQQLGKEYALAHLQPPSAEHINSLKIVTDQIG
jgi:pyruvate formate lyase activating enzyme